jgi:alginate O-acetyltransferase complex protein AlgI
MFFNSPEYIVFLTIVLFIYYNNSWRAQNWWLLGASYLFYGWWDPRFLSLIFLSTVTDYVAALRMEAMPTPRGKRFWLIASCGMNLFILGVFKYFNFFVDSATTLLESLGFEPHRRVLNIILPPGISFYTFQTMSYTIDVYRGQMRARRNFWDFALFVAYFPQLVAGPIERAVDLVPQLEKPRPRITGEKFASGLALILTGLFKKVAIADAAAPVADAAFAASATGSPGFLLSGVYAFAVQIYGDFSGYSDIARGTSRLFGVEVSRNFEAPYLATNITDFWRRWHISLSSWLRDYLYVPLGGNRSGAWKTYRNLLLTMLLGGLWHGAAWTFVAWGALHGLYLAIHRRWRDRHRDKPSPATLGEKLWRILQNVGSAFLTFHLVCFAWIFFRAGMEGFRPAWDVIRGLASGRDGAGEFQIVALWSLLAILLMDAAQRFTDRDDWLAGLPIFWKMLVAQIFAGGILLAALAAGAEARPFIYFQF